MKSNSMCRLLFLLVVLFSSKLSSAQLENVEYFLVNNKFDSAKIFLAQHSSNEYTQLLNKILTHKASYSELYTFLDKEKAYDLFPKSQEIQFVNEYIKEGPKGDDLNVDYVRLLYYNISYLRNNYALDEASKKNENLKHYIEKYKNKDQQSYQLAYAYCSIHDFMLLIIQEKIAEARLLCKEQINIATALSDTLLLINLKYYYSEVLIKEKLINEYIQNCNEIIALDNRPVKSDLYEANLEHLVDALIFKGGYNESEIENLLYSMYSSVDLKHQSYYYYLEYLESLPPKSKAQDRVLKLFGVSNIEALCDTMINRAANKINLNDSYLLHNLSASFLLKDKQYDKAFKYMQESIKINKKIYSKELSQAIADAQTRELNFTKDVQIAHVRNTQKSIAFIAICLIVFLIVLIVLIHKIRKKNIMLEAKNKENEILVNEIHHRVKNNFQTISSLLTLQGNHVQHEYTLDKINEIKSRIESMILIHQELFKTSYNQRVEFRSYSEQLIHHILAIYKLSSVEVQIEMNDYSFDINIAIPLGLILNELTTNACKHSLGSIDNGKIKLHLTQLNGNMYKLIFTDNGTNSAIKIDYNNANTLGLKLIKMLSNQLHGTCSFAYNNGAEFILEFNAVAEK